MTPPAGDATAFRVVIPARWGSTRLPGKPLADIGGRPMVEHVWRRARESGATEVVVASDDRRVLEAVAAFGGEGVVTAATHASGTDRLEEVARRCGWDDDAVVVNVQGDEPFVPPAVIDQVAANLAGRPSAAAATLAEPLAERAELCDPNLVKVVVDHAGYALYFSRAPVPYPRGLAAGETLPAAGVWRRHIGIYAYRVGLLHRFVDWPPAPSERLESLEQLRILHHGERIHVDDAVEQVPGGVDTAADLERVRRRLAPSA